MTDIVERVEIIAKCYARHLSDHELILGGDESLVEEWYKKSLAEAMQTFAEFSSMETDGVHLIEKLAASKQRCLQRDEKGDDICTKSARYIVWGHLYEKNQKGPRCYEHVAKIRMGHDGVETSLVNTGPEGSVFEIPTELDSSHVCAATIHLSDIFEALTVEFHEESNTGHNPAEDSRECYECRRIAAILDGSRGNMPDLEIVAKEIREVLAQDSRGFGSCDVAVDIASAILSLKTEPSEYSIDKIISQIRIVEFGGVLIASYHGFPLASKNYSTSDGSFSLRRMQREILNDLKNEIEYSNVPVTTGLVAFREGRRFKAAVWGFLADYKGEGSLEDLEKSEVESLIETAKLHLDRQKRVTAVAERELQELLESREAGV